MIGAQLLDDLTEWISRYIDLSPERLTAVVLWALSTWFVDIARHAPLLVVNSASPSCGKSNLLRLLERIAYNGVLTSRFNVSVAAMARKTEKDQVTLLIDEAGDWSADKDRDFVAFLNASYNQGQKYIRCEGDNFDPVSRECFGFRLLAGVGAEPPNHLVTKCLTVHLIPTDREVAFLLKGEVDERGEELARQIEEWVDASRDEIECSLSDVYEAHRPLVDKSRTRHIDNWVIMLAIARQAGGEWPQKAEAAFRHSYDVLRAEPEICLRKDLHAALEGLASEYDEHLPSSKLLEALQDKNAEAWGDVNYRRLAKMLKPYGVESVRKRHGDRESNPVWGYMLHDLQAVPRP